ncbi:MAG TPA: STAS domain-containing protein [Myxococcales bacterium]
MDRLGLRKERIPIIEMRGQLLVSVQRELNDVDAVALQDDILARLRETGARGVILDVTGMEIVDSYIARVFNDVGSSAASMGARTVLVGLRPAVAMTLVEMDVELTRVRSELTLDRALSFLERDEQRGRSAGPVAARK